MHRTQRRPIASTWMAIVAVLLLNVVPTLSTLLRDASAPPAWLEVCTTGNARSVSAVAFAEGAIAPQADEAEAPMSVQHALEHCQYCPLSAHLAGLLPTADATLASDARTYAVPFLFLRAPRTLNAWSPSLARAPPVLA